MTSAGLLMAAQVAGAISIVLKVTALVVSKFEEHDQ